MHRIKTLTTRSTTNLSLDQSHPRAQPDPQGLDQLPPPRREQPLFRLPQPLPVVGLYEELCRERRDKPVRRKE